MQSTGVPGRIHVTQDTYERLKDSFGADERLTKVKGRGMMKTYLLKEYKGNDDSFRERIDSTADLLVVDKGNGDQEVDPDEPNPVWERSLWETFNLFLTVDGFNQILNECGLRFEDPNLEEYYHDDLHKTRGLTNAQWYLALMSAFFLGVMLSDQFLESGVHPCYLWQNPISLKNSRGTGQLINKTNPNRGDCVYNSDLQFSSGLVCDTRHGCFDYKPSATEPALYDPLLLRAIPLVVALLAFTTTFAAEYTATHNDFLVAGTFTVASICQCIPIALPGTQVLNQRIPQMVALESGFLFPLLLNSNVITIFRGFGIAMLHLLIFFVCARVSPRTFVIQSSVGYHFDNNGTMVYDIEEATFWTALTFSHFMIPVMGLLVVASLGSIFADRYQRKAFIATESTLKEKDIADRYLYRMLPPQCIDMMKSGHVTVVGEFDQVSILFSDIVSFTKMSSQIAPAEVVKLLRELFSQFDRATEELGVFKVQTIGDAYVCVSGLPFNNLESGGDVTPSMTMGNRRTSFTSRNGGSTGASVTGRRLPTGKSIPNGIIAAAGAGGSPVVGRRLSLVDQSSVSVNPAGRSRGSQSRQSGRSSLRSRNAMRRHFVLDPIPHTTQLLRFGHRMIEAIKATPSPLGGDHVMQMRIGIHTGNIVAGVIGNRSFRYDMWGNDVRAANLMEEKGIPMRIVVSETTHAIMKKTDFKFDAHDRVKFRERELETFVCTDGPFEGGEVKKR